MYAISVPFESIAHLFLRAFYSLHDTFIPAVLGVLSGAAAILIAWFWAPMYGVLALPLGYTLGQVIETMVLGVLLERRIKHIKQ
jgi:peptidoglycan biosynthesis protein MviN/MurJ (putative lipid II flippase)